MGRFVFYLLSDDRKDFSAKKKKQNMHGRRIEIQQGIVACCTNDTPAQ